MMIGILAIQGAFVEHREMLKRLHIDSFEIRQKKDLDKPMDGLILPGGESTAMHRLLKDLDMYDPIRTMIQDGLPVFGTCAGMILLADQVTHPNQRHFGLMHISVKRNAYGRQLGSFYTHDLFGDTMIPMTFIRAPYIESNEKDVTILSVVDGHKVAARQGHMLVTAFHPELNESTVVHTYFLDMIKEKNLIA